MTLLLLITALSAGASEEEAVSHHRMELVQGAETQHAGATWTVSDLATGDGGEVAATVKAGDRTGALNRPAGEPLHWSGLGDVFLALDNIDLASEPGRAWVWVTGRAWTADWVLTQLKRAKRKKVDRFSDEEREVTSFLGKHAELFVGQSTDVFTAQIGPAEAAWGVPSKPDQLRWEIGVTPDLRRSGAPMLVVEHSGGTITDVRVALPL
jgi:hypothetical protein